PDNHGTSLSARGHDRARFVEECNHIALFEQPANQVESQDGRPCPRPIVTDHQGCGTTRLEDGEIPRQVKPPDPPFALAERGVVLPWVGAGLFDVPVHCTVEVWVKTLVVHG